MNRLFSSIILTTLLLTSCSEPPDEEVINHNIDQAIAGLSNKEMDRVLDNLSPEFTGSHKLDKKSAMRMMAFHFMRHKEVNVISTRRDTTVIGDTAVTRGTAILTGQSSFIPENGRLISYTGHWEKTEDKWFLRKLEWN
ncbi:nuclear transport factor 2 family protein [Parendozoicomonas sp. Alg238-R29]|uniref:nuclear transport factor 2 family protein n=1 Tax=Parendozoicomonas sp. Alg238-R29 TaxID=2993446 RepID=UPI00248E9622|nr:nuclear transport factor 2 family protein [Parendozoicomonas sp. Alg238-R29]